MGAVEFHTGVVDPLAFACRLLRKAHRQGHRVLVTAPAERLAELDTLLWTFDGPSFLPHVVVPPAQVAGAPDGMAARTPVWLCEAVPRGAVPAVLVNLGAGTPATLTPFERVIEIVSHDVDAAQAGRERWRAYKALGIEIVHHPSRSVGDAQD